MDEDDDPYCYKCGKKDRALLNCGMCNISAHRECFLVDFPDADMTVRRIWLCKFCRVMDSDLIVTAELNKSCRMLQYKYEGGVPEDYFAYHGVDENSLKSGKTGEDEMDRVQYFCTIGDETYAVMRNFNLSEIFPVENGYGLADEKTEIVVTNRYETKTGDFLVREESFNSKVDGEEGEVLVDDPKTSRESHISESIEFGKNFYVEWTETGVKIVEVTNLTSEECEHVDPPPGSVKNVPSVKNQSSGLLQSQTLVTPPRSKNKAANVKIGSCGRLKSKTEEPTPRSKNTTPNVKIGSCGGFQSKTEDPPSRSESTVPNVKIASTGQLLPATQEPPPSMKKKTPNEKIATCGRLQSKTQEPPPWSENKAPNVKIESSGQLQSKIQEPPPRNENKAPNVEIAPTGQLLAATQEPPPRSENKAPNVKIESSGQLQSKTQEPPPRSENAAPTASTGQLQQETQQPPPDSTKNAPNVKTEPPVQSLQEAQQPPPEKTYNFSNKIEQLLRETEDPPPESANNVPNVMEPLSHPETEEPEFINNDQTQPISLDPRNTYETVKVTFFKEKLHCYRISEF